MNRLPDGGWNVSPETSVLRITPPFHVSKRPMSEMLLAGSSGSGMAAAAGSTTGSPSRAISATANICRCSSASTASCVHFVVRREEENERPRRTLGRCNMVTLSLATSEKLRRRPQKERRPADRTIHPGIGPGRSIIKHGNGECKRLGKMCRRRFRWRVAEFARIQATRKTLNSCEFSYRQNCRIRRTCRRLFRLPGRIAQATVAAQLPIARGRERAIMGRLPHLFPTDS